MLRVSAIAEQAGVPTSSLCCEGFLGQAKTTSVGLGYPNLALATVPGHVDVQTPGRAARPTCSARRSTRDPQPHRRDRRGAGRPSIPTRTDIVFDGSFEEVNRLFLENGWSDGLPIVPPTMEQDRRVPAPSPICRPIDAIGKLLPDNRMRHGVERRGQRRDGRLPAGVHADPGGAGRGDGRSAVRRRAFRQHAGRGDADRAQRADDQAARLQLRAGRAARRLPAQHARSAASGGSTCATSRASCCTRTTRAPSATPGASCWRRTRTAWPG